MRTEIRLLGANYPARMARPTTKTGSGSVPRDIVRDRSKTAASTAAQSERYPVRAAPRMIRRPARVTVCIAALFQWATPNGGSEPAILTASDRTITVADIEYEPDQQKVVHFTQHTIGLVSGEYPIHSYATSAVKRIIATRPSLTVHEIAVAYGDTILGIKREHAAKYILSPLGLTIDSFLRREHEFSASLVNDLRDRLQNFRGKHAEALIAGFCEGAGHIYLVDSEGIVSYYNDVGFIAIGVGEWHARSQLMLSRYSASSSIGEALVSVFRAKKSAEVAPGVGPKTDMYFVTANGAIPVKRVLMDALENQYERYTREQEKLVSNSVADLLGAIMDFVKSETNLQSQSSRMFTPRQPADANALEAAPPPSTDSGTEHQDDAGTVRSPT